MKHSIGNVSTSYIIHNIINNLLPTTANLFNKSF